MTDKFDPIKEFLRDSANESAPVSLTPDSEEVLAVPQIVSLRKKPKEAFESAPQKPAPAPVQSEKRIDISDEESPEPEQDEEVPWSEVADIEPVPAPVINRLDEDLVYAPPNDTAILKQYEYAPEKDEVIVDIKMPPKPTLRVPRTTVGHAKLYHELGFRVIAVMANDKRPAHKWKADDGEGFTLTPDTFDDHFEHADYNIGMRCDGHFVIDIDMNREKGKKGDESFKRLFGDDAIERLKETTLWQTSGGGGLQFFFKLTPDTAPYLNNSSNIFGDNYPDIDCRYDSKGITVLPPSIHPSGNAYTWGNLSERLKESEVVSAAPEWFTSTMREARIEKVKQVSKTRYRSGSTDWRTDKDLVFDVHSFKEVSARVFELLQDEPEARQSGDFVNARVDSYDGNERLAIYASKNGVLGDWKLSPKTEILLALGIDPRVWLLQYADSDRQFADAFYYYYGHRVVWVPERKVWGVLKDDNTWEFTGHDSLVWGLAMQLIDDWRYAWQRAEIVRKSQQIAESHRESPEESKRGRKKKQRSRGEKMLDWLKSLENGNANARIFAVLKSYHQESKVAGDRLIQTLVRGAGEFDQLAEDEFPAANGIINLRTGELRPFAAADFITSTSPVLYDPNISTVEFRNAIQWWFNGDVDMMNYFKKIAGYFTTADVDESKLFIFYGYEGRNGKSTAMDLLQAVLGTEMAKQTELATLTNERESRYFLAGAVNARLVTIREANFRSLSTMIVKYVTGDRSITARPIYGKPFDYIRKSKWAIATNVIPSFQDIDGGMKRRLEIIPFFRVPDHAVDLGFLRKWNARLPVVLKWLVEGAQLYFKEGLGNPPEKVLQATSEELGDASGVQQFIDEMVEWVDDPKSQVSRQEVWQTFVRWSQSTGNVASNRQVYNAIRNTCPHGKPDFVNGEGKRAFRFMKLGEKS